MTPAEPATGSQPPRRLLPVVVAATLAAVALSVGGVFAYRALFGAGADPARADAALGRAFSAISPVDSQRCPESDHPLGCLRATAQRNEHEFRGFLAALEEIDFPSEVDTELAAVRRDVSRFCHDLADLAGAGNLREFQRAAGGGDVARHSRVAYSDVQALHRALLALR